MSSDTVPVIQADRDAAADFSIGIQRGFFAAYSYEYRSGERDSDELVQAFARHRHAATPTPSPAMPSREEIARAIQAADDAFGYSFNMTSLVDGVATHTLKMDGYDPVDFEDRDDGYRLIEERRNAARATALYSLLAALTSADRASGQGDGAKVCRHINKPSTECREHNLHCGYPACLVPTPPSDVVPGEQEIG